MSFELMPGAEEDQLSCNMADVPIDKSNLVVKVLYNTETARPEGFVS